MPNRIIKESVCGSETVDALSWFEEVFFYRLIVNCDDYGRMDARPAILRSRLFPLKSVTDKQVVSALQSLRSVGIVDLYEVDGRPFLQIRTWERHQIIRAKKSRYPSPDSGVKSSESICKQVHANVSVIQSESESEYESESESERGNTPPRKGDPKTGEAAHRYGEYRNVLLSDEDMDKLRAEFPTDYESRIERLSSYIASTGKVYKNHLATIRNWARNDKTAGAAKGAQGENIFLSIAKEEGLV